jgi:hypothetical protein
MNQNLSPPENANARRATGRRYKLTSESKIASAIAPVKPDAVTGFIQHPTFETFRDAFPFLAGRDLTLDDWLETNRDSQPQNLAEWVARIYDALVIDDFCSHDGNEPETRTGTENREQNPNLNWKKKHNEKIV